MRNKDYIAIKIAGLIPLRVRYWVTMREIGKATFDKKKEVMSLPLDEVLRGLESPDEKFDRKSEK